jgi:hypothetical protein
MPSETAHKTSKHGVQFTEITREVFVT